MAETAGFDLDVGVIGGGGHVGLPLALMFADCGFRTLVFDTDQGRVEWIRRGEMPFRERGADDLLRTGLAEGRLRVEATPAALHRCRYLVCIVGTPVDEHLNPGLSEIVRALEDCREEFRDGQVLVLRSTVFPGTSQRLQTWFDQLGKRVSVAFCPERVAQGNSLEEFRTLPQIVSAFDPPTLAAVKELFARFAPEFIEMAPMEAELCKLMTNAWRYIQFAAINQFYTIATRAGCDFDRILHGCRHHYPRTQGMPGPGLAAGPCLVKDTMQLAAFSRHNFPLGHSAMVVNEGLPAFLIDLAKSRIDLSDKTAGILGMAFKGESDDPRDSLSYKLRKLLKFEAARVLCCDPYVRDRRLVPVERVVAESQVLFVATPHRAFRTLEVPPQTVAIDVWGCLPRNGEEPIS